MPVEVGGGALSFEAEVDLSKFDISIDTMNKKIADAAQKGVTENKKFQESIENAAKSASNQFNPKTVDEWTAGIAKAAQNLQAILAKGSTLIDPSKLEGLNQQVLGTNSTFGQLSATIDFIKQNLGSLNLNPEDLKTLAESINTIETGFDGFTQKTVQATTRIRQLKNEMTDMSDKGSPQFQELATEAGRLQQEINESNKSVALLASTTGGLQAGVGILRGAVGAFEAVAGAVGLASGKSEEMEHVISSIIAAMGVLNGIQEVAEVINKRSALNQYLLLQLRKFSSTATKEQAVATTLLTGATEAETLATEGATVATAELNATMLANPALAVIAGIAALAAAVYYLTQKSTEADDASARFNKTLLEQYNLSNQIYQLSRFSTNSQISAQEVGVELLRAQNASQKQIIDAQIVVDKLKQDQAVKDVQKAKDDLNFQRDVLNGIKNTYNEYNKLNGLKPEPLKLDFADNTDIPSLIKNLSQLQNKIIDLKSVEKGDEKNKSLIDALQSKVDLLKPKIESYIESLKNLSAVSSKTTIDAVTEVEEGYARNVKSFTAAQEAKTSALALSSAEQLRITLNAIKAETAAQLDPNLNKNLTTGEKEKILADSLKRQADAVFQSNQKEYSDKIKLINSEAQLYQVGTKERLDLELKALETSKQAQLQQVIELNGQTIQYKKLSGVQQLAVTNEINAQIIEKTRAFNKQLAADQLEIQINLDKARLSSVEDGSQEQLAIRKDLLDQQAALDISSSQFTIHNQELLAARIKQIFEQTVADKKKLEDEFADNQLKNTLKIIQAAADQQKQINILTSGNTPEVQATNADVDLDSVKKQWAAVSNAILEVIRTGNGDINALIEIRRGLFAKFNSIGEGVKNPDLVADSATKTAQVLNQVGNSINQLGNNLKQYDSTLGDVITSLGSLAKNAALIETLLSKDVTTEQQVAAGLEATVQLISSVISASAQRAAAEQQFNAELLASQLQYNIALNDSLLLNSKLKESVFVEDFQGQLKDGIAALADAQKNYQESLRDLSKGVAKDGQRTSVGAGSVLSGAASGAVLGFELGTAFPVIGNVVGTVVGGIVGGIVGLFGGKKQVDKYVSLLQEYPELLQKGANGQVEINKELAKSLIANNQLDSATKVLVQNTLDWQDAIDKANEQMKGVIKDLSGSLGNDLSDSLVKAFEDGTDAAKAFAESVQKTLENVLQNMLFNTVFGSAFTDLQQKLQDSFQQGGDFNWQDDLEGFFQQYSGLSKDFDDALKAAQIEAKKAGLDIFQASSDTQGAKNSLAGAIKGITEQQADLLAGQFGGLRITALDQLRVSQNSYAVLQEIAQNTAMLLDVKATLIYFRLNGIKIAS